MGIPARGACGAQCDGCILCLGGLADWAQARSLFFPVSRRTEADWRRQRAGSLRSLNPIAAHLGLRLLEDLVAERVDGSPARTNRRNARQAARGRVEAEAPLGTLRTVVWRAWNPRNPHSAGTESRPGALQDGRGTQVKPIERWHKEVVMSLGKQLTSIFRLFSRSAPFRVVDHEALAEKLAPDKVGADRGGQNEPHPTESGPDATEQGFLRHFAALLRGVNKEFGDALTRAQVLRDQERGRFSAQRFADLFSAAVHELDTLRANLREMLTVAREREQHALRMLKHFRTIRGIARDAEYPDSYARLYAVLAIAILVEAIANSFLFAMGSPYGLVGGLQEAMIVAALNVLLSYQVGSALRGLHNPGWRRVGAAVLGVCFICGLVIFHLAVGHYRAALTGPSPETAMTTAISTLKADPLGALDSVHTWLLVLVGALAALGAAVGGYKSDDVIIGYGRVYRRHKLAEVEYVHAKQAYRDGIQATGDAALGAVERQVEDAQQATESYRASVNEARDLVTDYELLVEGIRNSYVTTVQRYRSANLRVRTEPEPAFFHEPPVQFDDGAFLDVGLLEVSAPEEIAAELRDAWQRVLAAGDAVKRDLRALIAERLKEIPDFVRSVEEAVMLPERPARQPLLVSSGNGARPAAGPSDPASVGRGDGREMEGRSRAYDAGRPRYAPEEGDDEASY